jgi:hypothetical protein
VRGLRVRIMRPDDSMRHVLMDGRTLFEAGRFVRAVRGTGSGGELNQRASPLGGTRRFQPLCILQGSSMIFLRRLPATSAKC